MTQDAPRPITIVDPSAPARSLDVLGKEPREPRRVTMRQVLRALLAVLVLAALVAGTTALLQHRARQAAAALLRTEQRGVTLTLPPDGVVAATSFPGFDNETNNAAQLTAGTATVIIELQVQDTGHTAVELLGGVLDVPGWAVQASGRVTTGQLADLHLVRHLSCAQELHAPAPDPTALLLDVRLPAGGEYLTRVPLPRLVVRVPSGLAATLHSTPLRACGVPPAWSAGGPGRRPS